ncbi:MAG TPA: thioredoxin family protein [Campylobacterales bacterium]|nr:thioredoxin family protein [Campylobacterales bacterium]
MKIEILGTGCAKCKMLLEITQNAVEKAGVDAEIVKVEDPIAIMNYGVMSTPALVVDQEVKMSGRLPSADEIVEILK